MEEPGVEESRKVSPTWPNQRTDPALAITTAELMDRAALEQEDRGYNPAGPFEFNAPATLIMLLDARAHSGVYFLSANEVQLEAQHMMMQLAFINYRLHPGYAWIYAAVHAGWHYDTRFYRLN